MKISKLLYLLIICFAIYSCGDDDSEPGNTPPDQVENFFPLVTGNSWDFENVFMSPNQDDFVSNETLSVTNSTTNGTIIEYDLETDNPVNAGAVTSALNQGILSKSGTSLFFTGNLTFAVEDFPGLDIGLDNAPIYDLSASADTELFSDNGSFDDTFEGVPITINYTIKTVMGDRLNSFIVNGTIYDDVIKSQIIITAEIKATVFLEVTVLQEQEVVKIDNYFAKDIGMIFSDANVNFDFIDVDLPIDLEDIMLDSTQSLEAYSVELD